MPFTLTVDKQDDHRFSGTFASPRSTEPIIAVISHTGAIFLVDDYGYTVGTMLAAGPDGALLHDAVAGHPHRIVYGAAA